MLRILPYGLAHGFGRYLCLTSGLAESDSHCGSYLCFGRFVGERKAPPVECHCCRYICAASQPCSPLHCSCSRPIAPNRCSTRLSGSYEKRRQLWWSAVLKLCFSCPRRNKLLFEPGLSPSCSCRRSPWLCEVRV